MGSDDQAGENGKTDIAFTASGLCKVYRTGDTEVHALRGADLTRFRRANVGFIFQFYNLIPSLTAREAVRVKPGDRAEITQWGGDKPLTGKVKRIEPFGKLKVSALGIEEQRANVIIGFDSASAGQAARLGHGYQIDATVILWATPDAVRVPIGALFRGADGAWRVFVVEAGRARERAVKIGHINEQFGEVLEGLAADQQVIFNPPNRLADGARVRPR